MSNGKIVLFHTYEIDCAGDNCYRGEKFAGADATRLKARKFFSMQGWHRVGNRWLCPACWEKRKAERIAASEPERGE